MKKKDIIKALSASMSECDVSNLLDCSSCVHDYILDNGFHVNKANKVFIESLATLSVITKALIEKLNVSDEVEKEEENLICDIISSIAIENAEYANRDEIDDDFDSDEDDFDFSDDLDDDDLDDDDLDFDDDDLDSDKDDSDSDDDDFDKDDFDFSDDDMDDDFHTVGDSDTFEDNLEIDDSEHVADDCNEDDSCEFEADDEEEEDVSEYDTEECDYICDGFGDTGNKTKEHKKDFKVKDDFLGSYRKFQKGGNK